MDVLHNGIAGALDRAFGHVSFAVVAEPKAPRRPRVYSLTEALLDHIRAHGPCSLTDLAVGAARWRAVGTGNATHPSSVVNSMNQLIELGWVHVVEPAKAAAAPMELVPYVTTLLVASRTGPVSEPEREAITSLLVGEGFKVSWQEQ